MIDSTICSAAGTLYRAPKKLGLFDQINLARCAAERAKANVWDIDRFAVEYAAAASWSGKRVKTGW
jgi:hypothetical protein